jgi:predicted esterase
MRVLCLHGVGSSATVLENQLRRFVQAVDPSYEFVFVDGPVPSERGPGKPESNKLQYENLGKTAMLTTCRRAYPR